LDGRHRGQVPSTRTGELEIMQRTHACLSRKTGIDPKLVAHQLGHGIGVNIDSYTISHFGQRIGP